MNGGDWVITPEDIPSAALAAILSWIVSPWAEATVVFGLKALRFCGLRDGEPTNMVGSLRGVSSDSPFTFTARFKRDSDSELIYSFSILCFLSVSKDCLRHRWFC